MFFRGQNTDLSIFLLKRCVSLVLMLTGEGGKESQDKNPWDLKGRHHRGPEGKDPVDKLYLLYDLGQDSSASPSSGIRKIDVGPVTLGYA